MIKSINPNLGDLDCGLIGITEPECQRVGDILYSLSKAAFERAFPDRGDTPAVSEQLLARIAIAQRVTSDFLAPEVRSSTRKLE